MALKRKRAAYSSAKHALSHVGYNVGYNVAKKAGKYVVQNLSKRVREYFDRKDKRRKLNSKTGRPVAQHASESSYGTRQAKVVNRVKRGVTMKKPRKVVVSKKFRTKVETALKPKTITGKFLEISTGALSFSTTLGNRQQVSDLGIAVNGVTGQFTPGLVLDAASVLFNSKTGTLDTKWSNTGSSTSFGAQSLDARTVKITVNNSYSAFVLRNNSNRTWIIQLYEAQPKQKMNWYSEGTFVNQWRLAMVNEDNTGATAGLDVNIAGATESTLYETPYQHKTLMAKWKVERHEIILDPGQTYDHFMQGPAGVTYDFQKFWKPTGPTGASTEFQDLQPKFSRQLVMVARMDLTQSGTKLAGRWGIPEPSGTSALFGRLLVETKNYYNIQCPEQVAGLSSAQNVMETNNARRDCYYHKHWNESTTIEPEYRIDEETGGDNQVVPSS